VDLSFAGQMRFAGGALTQFFSSFQAVPHTEVDILGSAGRIHLDVPYLNKVGVSSHIRIWRTNANRTQSTFGDVASQFDEETLTYDNINGYQHEIDAMAACILDGAEPVVPLADSRGTVATLAALSKSAREGRPVRLESK
jgi:predicted dehydrogenase